MSDVTTLLARREVSGSVSTGPSEDGLSDALVSGLSDPLSSSGSVQMEKNQTAKGPTTSKTAKATGDIADLLAVMNPALGGGAAVLSGMSGMTGEVTAGDQSNPLGVVGGVAKVGEQLSGIGAHADDMLPTSFGGIGNVASIASGTMDAMDSTKDTGSRVLGGLDAAANVGSLSGTLGGAAVTPAVLSGGAGTALAGSGLAMSMAAGGAVLGAGVVGAKVGGVINDVSDSEYAKSSLYGQDLGGQDRTPTDAMIDTMAGVSRGVADVTGSETLGTIVGGAGTVLGSAPAAVMGMGTAAYNYMFGEDR